MWQRVIRRLSSQWRVPLLADVTHRPHRPPRARCGVETCTSPWPASTGRFLRCTVSAETTLRLAEVREWHEHGTNRGVRGTLDQRELVGAMADSSELLNVSASNESL
jgi:hypothetical protein